MIYLKWTGSISQLCSFTKINLSDYVNLNKSDIIGTDEDPGLRIESFAIIKSHSVSTKI